jgi:pimeloyl-ACP methyl ester carboxylesterase
MSTKSMTTGLVEANGTQLYHEIRGGGPPVVLIHGGGGYAGVFQPTAELLAATYTVVTYDRRGNSRSPKPDGWDATSIEEQADDCVGLIEALGVERPVVLGHSYGGTILVGLLERHADALRGAIVYEPLLPSVAPSYAGFAEGAAKRFVEALAAGDDPWDRFARWAFGDDAWELHPAEMRAEASRNGDVNAEIESPAFLAFVPNADALASVRIPVHAVYGERTTTPITCVVEGAEWVSRTTGGPLHAFPGDHTTLTTRPAEVVEALRPILESMSKEG